MSQDHSLLEPTSGSESKSSPESFQSLSPDGFTAYPMSQNLGDYDDEIILPNDFKYYQNNFDKNQFNLTLINCSINLIKLLYLNNPNITINDSNLRFFIIQVLKRSKTSIQNLQISCYYLLKLISHDNDKLIDNPKHLFLGLIILSSKFNQDANYSFKTWLKIIGLPQEQSQINFLKSVEINLLSNLEYNLYINNSTYENWCNILLIFGYDFIKCQKIHISKSEIIWDSNEKLINEKLSKWKLFFQNLTEASLAVVNIKFINYFLNQFNKKIFIVHDLTKKRVHDTLDTDMSNDKNKIVCK